jgi:type II secretory pathway pseudopilin PulG
MRNSRADAGFTLPEALVAMGLTLMILGAAITAFTQSINLFAASRAVSETNHGLQAAMSLMVRDLRQAGQGVPLGGVPIPSGDDVEALVRPGPPLDPDGDGVPLTFPEASTLPALSPGAGLGPTLLGVPTDMVTLLYADPTIALSQYPLASIAADGSSMEVDARTSLTGADGIKVGDLILFTNANGSAMQMVTSAPDGQTVAFALNDALHLNQRAASQGTLLSLQSSPGVFPPTTATRLLMISYYIDAQTDSTLPRLIRRVNDNDPLVIAMGIENLQLSYDIVDGETNPANVDDLPDGASANQLRKVNIFLSGRSEDKTTPTGEYFRNSMTTDVGLRSLSYVDRYR